MLYIRRLIIIWKSWLMKVKDFVAINFSKYFKSRSEEKNLRKATKSLHIFLATTDEVEEYAQSNSCDNCIHLYNVEILNIFDPELQLTFKKNTISMIMLLHYY